MPSVNTLMPSVDTSSEQCRDEECFCICLVALIHSVKELCNFPLSLIGIFSVLLEFEHIVQSQHDTCRLGVHSELQALPYTTQFIRCPTKKK